MTKLKILRILFITNLYIFMAQYIELVHSILEDLDTVKTGQGLPVVV